MGLLDLFRKKAGGENAPAAKFHTAFVRDRARREKIAGIEIAKEICAFTTGTMTFREDGALPEITVRFEARRNVEEGGWDIRRFTDVPEGMVSGIAPGQGDAFMGHAGCDFDALRFLSEESAARGFRARDEGAGHRDRPHWKDVAAQARQPIDRNGVVQPVVAGQVLADNVTFDDPEQMAIRDSTLPPAIAPAEKPKPPVKQPAAPAPAGRSEYGFLRRAFHAVLPRPKPGVLIEAVRRDAGEKVRWLLARGADVNEKDNWGHTPLHEAARYGRTAIVRMLIDAGAAVHAKDWLRDTPLHEAAGNGHTETARMLIDAGADVHAKNRDGKTALDCAVRKGRHGAAALLREAMERQKGTQRAPPPMRV